MKNFEQEKAQLIAQIQQRNILIDGLTAQNGKSGLLNSEQLGALEDIKAKNQTPRYFGTRLAAFHALWKRQYYN